MPRSESAGRSGGSRKSGSGSGRRRNSRSNFSSRFTEKSEQKGGARFGKKPFKKSSRFSEEPRPFGKRFSKRATGPGREDQPDRASFRKKSTGRFSERSKPGSDDRFEKSLFKRSSGLREERTSSEKKFSKQSSGDRKEDQHKRTTFRKKPADYKPSADRFQKKPYLKAPRKREDSASEKRGFFNKQKFSRHETLKEAGKHGESTPGSGKIRLNKFISNSGVCSRREADNLISMGLISVNGNVVTEMGYKVNPGDEVRYEGKVLRAERPVYILMNKPKGFLTTTSDPQERNTVMHIIGNAVKERVYPVGRLDRNTTGLLLLTNDGDLADKLSHPSYNVKKIYKVEIDKALTKADFQKIIEGVQLEEGRAMVDDLAIVSPDGKTIGVELHIGWNRVVRRIFETLGYQVVKLDRTVYAGLDKKDLPRGEWRFLKPEEVVRLKHFK
ncbi:MAG: pseudouridine synthase [Cyclobacteriaceae bacterium]